MGQRGGRNMDESSNTFPSNNTSRQITMTAADELVGLRMLETFPAAQYFTFSATAVDRGQPNPLPVFCLYSTSKGKCLHRVLIQSEH